MRLNYQTKHLIVSVLTKLWVLGMPVLVLAFMYYGLSMFLPRTIAIGCLALVVVMMMVEDGKYLLRALRYPLTVKRPPDSL